MKTGRPDLDALVKVASIPADEPTFILRAQDRCAADAVRDWAARQKAAGAPLAVVEQALQQADAMDRWPVKKDLDDGHLPDDVAKQLAYQHARREWNSGKIIAQAHQLALEIVILDALIAWGDGTEHLMEIGFGELIAKARELKAARHG
jgi:hypothetical protein